ncbi:MAG: hydroxyacylglutathione hydrolase [Chloroflexota bacterium]|nr:hydroxyacylglutathione hydrolase [Chloroflexota bacterium]
MLTQVADDVHQLYGLPPHGINAYIAGGVLVDALTRWGGRVVLTALRHHPVEMVTLTHCHPDHQGVAAMVRTLKGVPLACHEADVEWMEGTTPVAFRNPVINRLQGAWAGPACAVDRVLHDGDEVGGFRVVHAPGHTPGHVMYHRAADGVVICGDVVSNQHPVTRRPRLAEPPEMYSTDPAENRRSIRRLVDLRPSLVLFGHGPPLRDVSLLDAFAERLGL